ncbi:MAG: hypothetical protein CL793_05875 [Chloroflexi bacterium]|nr:hypothetical protein [Chloroflexota bacterium]
MESEIQSYINHFEQTHQELQSILNSLPESALHWAPLEDDANSPAILVTHMLGAERFRIHQIVAGYDIHRDRESEFQTSTATLDDLRSTLEQVNADTKKMLLSITTADLDKIRPAARDYEQAESGRWHVLHTIEHFGIHLGHLSLTIQLHASKHQ